MRERGRKWYKERGKWIVQSRIEFPDPMLMTLDTPHGPITKFLKKCPKNEGKIIFSPLWCLIQKLDHNSGLHAKNQREISKNDIRSPLFMEMWTFPFKLFERKISNEILDFFLWKIWVFFPFVSLISLNYSFNVVVYKISLLIYLWWLSSIFVFMFFGIYFF